MEETMRAPKKYKTKTLTQPDTVDVVFMDAAGLTPEEEIISLEDDEEDAGSGGDEGERRTQDFITRAHTGQTEGEMQRSRSRRDSDRMFRTDDDGEIFFKRVEIRTRRRDPIGLEGFKDEFNFRGAHIRGR